MKRSLYSAFRSVHPFTAFCYYAGLIVLAMLQYHPIITLGLFLLSIGLAYTLGLRTELKRLFIFYPIIFTFMIGFNMLFNHRGARILFYWLDQPVTFEAILYGGQNALLLGTVWAAFISYQQVVTPQRFLYLFASIAPRISLMITMSLRFVPQLLRRLHELSDVQRTRGIDPRQGSIRKRSRDAMRQMQILITWSMEDAVQTADSMLARGYGTGERGRFEPYRYSIRDIWLLVALTALASLSIVCWLLGWGRMDIYPQLTGYAVELDDWTAASAVWLYAGIPALLEGRELWRWRSYPSNT